MPYATNQTPSALNYGFDSALRALFLDARLSELAATGNLCFHGPNKQLIPDVSHGPWLTDDNHQRIQNVESGQRIPPFQLPHGTDTPYRDVYFSPDGMSFAFTIFTGEKDYEYEIEWHEIASNRLIRKFKYTLKPDPSTIGRMRFSSDGRELLRVLTNGIEKIPLDGSQPRFIRLPQVEKNDPNSRVFNADLSPDSQLVSREFYKRDENPIIEIYDATNGRLRHTIKRDRDLAGLATDFHWSPDASLLTFANRVVPGSDFGTWIWDVKSGRKLWDFKGADSGFCFSPDNRTLATFSHLTREIELHDAKTGQIQRTITLPRHVSRLVYSSAGNSIYALTVDGKLWKVRVR